MTDSSFNYTHLTLEELRTLAASPQVGAIEAMPPAFRHLASRMGEVADLLTQAHADLPNWWKGKAADQAAAALARAAAEAHEFHGSAQAAATAIARCATIVAEQQHQIMNVPEAPEPGVTAIIERPKTPMDALEAARRDVAYQAAREQAVQVVNGIAAQYVETRERLANIGGLLGENFEPANASSRPGARDTAAATNSSTSRKTDPVDQGSNYTRELISEADIQRDIHHATAAGGLREDQMGVSGYEGAYDHMPLPSLTPAKFDRFPTPSNRVRRPAHRSTQRQGPDIQSPRIQDIHSQRSAALGFDDMEQLNMPTFKDMTQKKVIDSHDLSAVHNAREEQPSQTAQDTTHVTPLTQSSTPHEEAEPSVLYSPQDSHFFESAPSESLKPPTLGASAHFIPHQDSTIYHDQQIAQRSSGFGHPLTHGVSNRDEPLLAGRPTQQAPAESDGAPTSPLFPPFGNIGSASRGRIARNPRPAYLKERPSTWLPDTIAAPADGIITPDWFNRS